MQSAPPPAAADYSRLEHVKLVQAVISRMAQNSFALKGWSVTLVAALMAVAVNAKSSAYATLGFFPAVVFWGLDAYYLWQERRFRQLHVAICEGRYNVYTLSAEPGRRELRAWFRTLFRPTVLLLHAAVLVVAVAVALSLKR